MKAFWPHALINTGYGNSAISVMILVAFIVNGIHWISAYRTAAQTVGKTNILVLS